MNVLITARDPAIRRHLEEVARQRGHDVESTDQLTDLPCAQVVFADARDIAVVRAAICPSTSLCAVMGEGDDPSIVLADGADDWLCRPEEAAARLCALERSRSLQPALQALPDVVVTVDSNRRILSINREAHPPLLSSVGTDAADWVVPQHREVLIDNVARVFASGEPRRYMVEVDDGTWYESSIAPVFRGDQVAAAVIVARDITDRVHAESAMKASEARTRAAEESFKLLIERMPDMVLLHRAGLVVWANAACAETMGYASAEEMLGTQVMGYVAEEDREVIADRIAEMSRTGEPAPGIEVCVLKKDGSKRTFELAPVHFVEFEGARSSLVVARDVTQKKEIQERLLASERLASMGSLAACMAHEINNPLTYVIGNLSYVARALAEQLEDSSRALRLEMAIADAREGVERVRRIVSDLTTLAQFETEELRVIDLRRTLESTLSVAHNEIKHRARLEKSYGFAPYVRANVVRIGQVLLDLLLCAARGIPEGTANQHVIAVSTDQDARGGAVVEIRSRSSRPAEPPQKVLPGLTLAKQMVGGMGGELSVALDGPNQLVLRLMLPAAEGEPDVSSAHRSTSSDLDVERSPRDLNKRARILVVDDEPVIASTMRRALEGHDIYVVTSGRDALELCRGQDFDLVLCDLMMPDLTGMDLYEQLRRDAAGNEKRIIFMTGGAFTPRARSFLAQIPNTWVEKPFDVDQIQSLVDDYIHSARSA